MFVDTSAYFAFASPDDPNFQATESLFNTLSDTRYRLYTTQLVLAETHTLLRSRLKYRGRAYALAIARDTLAGIYESGVIVEPVSAANAREAMGILFTYPDQELSFTDATSFAVMHRLNIAHVVSFDDDFAVAGFTSFRHTL